ncbi:hypothetical protein IWQ61_002636 [Dispira simplex]|nr:hypothetical protein IWQ61_002636 [Dispira simplex]
MTMVKKALVVGLGNYSYAGTRHNVGMMVLDHVAERLNLTWARRSNVQGWVTSLTITVVPRTPLLNRAKRKSRKLTADTLKAQLLANLAQEGLVSPSTSEGTFKPALKESVVTSMQQPLSEPPVAAALPVTWEINLLKPRLFMNESGRSVTRALREFHVPCEHLMVVHDDMQRELGKISPKNGGSANGHNGIKSVIDCIQTNDFRRLRIGIGRPSDDTRARDKVSDFVLGKFTITELETLTTVMYPQCWKRWPTLFLPPVED